MTAAPENPAPDGGLSHVRRVLVIKPSSLGDIVHTLPSVHDLKVTFPHLEITWVANTEWLPLLQGNPDLEATLEFPRQRLRGIRGAWPAWRWMRALPERCRSEVTFDFQGLFRSGLMAWFSRSPLRLGLEDAREGSGIFHHRQVPVDPDVHAVDRYRRLVASMGVATDGPAVFSLPPGAELNGAGALPSPCIALHPFSRGQGKSLSIDQVNAFCWRAAQPVVLLGRVDPAERSRLRLPQGCLDLLNETSIPQLITCLRQARAIISVDSGPMHLAAAIQPARLLGIHTWSDPRKVGPYPGESWVWKGGEIHRRRDLSPALCARVQEFEDHDVDTLVRWAGEAVS